MYVKLIQVLKTITRNDDIHAQMRTSPHFFRTKLNGSASKSRKKLDHETRANDRFFGSTEE